VIKVELLLAGQQQEHSSQISVLGDDLANGVQQHGRVRAVAHNPSILSGLAHGAETAAAPPFVGLVEITLDEGDTATAVATLSAPMDRAGWLDRTASAVVVGPELTVVPGDERIMLAMALTRRAGMPLADFTEYWSTKHADLGRQVPGSEGYRQVHLDTELTSQARELTGFTGPRFDGVALAYYSTEATFQAIMANAEITARLLEDERRFIDHSRAAMVVGARPVA
jgi:hypothetical protein